MRVQILREAGYEEAMLGLSLSWASNKDRSAEIATKLAYKHGGHNKFLESMVVWIDIVAPRYWWSEMDTYRVGVTKQSESTMHTITKRHLNQSDFERPVELDRINNLIDEYHRIDSDKKSFLVWIKNTLPEGFLQRRIVCTNYKALQNIYHQRKSHRLPEWSVFCDSLLGLEHSEFIFGSKDDGSDG